MELIEFPYDQGNGREDMIKEDDWRLDGQEEYLRGVYLRLTSYRLGDPGYDHDHCEFCWRKIAVFDDPDAQRVGYATVDRLHWVCRQCFEDFKEMFAWEVD